MEDGRRKGEERGEGKLHRKEKTKTNELNELAIRNRNGLGATDLDLHYSDCNNRSIEKVIYHINIKDPASGPVKLFSQF